MGRPKKDEQALHNFISTALNDQDAVRFGEAARKNGKTKSAILRELLLKFCEESEENCDGN